MCNFCRHWSPLLRHVRAQLDDQGKELLTEYVNHMMAEAQDAECDQAKLNGYWPGWEALRGFNPHTHKVVLMTEEEKTEYQRIRDGGFEIL